MTIYRVKRHDKKTGESRTAGVAADSKDEAVFICEQQEVELAGFWLPGDEVKELEAKEAAGTLSGREKAWLFSHRQDKPYSIVSAKGDDS